MKLIVGLGNPGDQYHGTRHNLGFTVIDALAHKLELTDQHWDNSDRFQSMVAKLKHGEHDIVLAKPQTYMNNSGMGVQSLLQFYKVSPEDLVVIYDDIDVKLGQIKIRQGGGAAGHHGVESIMEKIGTDNFVRVRLGIAPEQRSGLAKLAEHDMNSFSVDKFVIAAFDAHEKSKVKSMIKHAVNAVDILVEEGLLKAQNQFN